VTLPETCLDISALLPVELEERLGDLAERADFGGIHLSGEEVASRFSELLGRPIIY
jgi:hypothetical protein